MFLFPKGPLMEAAGEGGESGGGLTAEAVAKLVTDAVNNAVNGLDKRYSKVLKELEAKIGQPPPKGEEPPAEDPPQGDKKPDAATAKLTKQVTELTARLEAEANARKAAEARAAEEKRHSVIRNELAKHQYAKENGIDAAFRLLSDEIKYGETGDLETPDGSAIGEFIAGKLNKEYDYLLAPVPKGGSGAVPGARGGGGVSLEDIKPGASAETLNSARAAIVASLNSNQ